MIAPETVRRIERLLAEGTLGQREIAKVTGVSRGSVGAIATGKRLDYEELRRRRRQQEEQQPERTGPPRRCPDCGGLVLKPCMACELRRDAATAPGHQPGAWSGRSAGLLELELRGEHRARYERIRARREAEGELAAQAREAQESRGRRRKTPRLTPRQLRDALEYDDGPMDDEVPVA